MTNQEQLDLVLELAKLMGPEKKWVIREQCKVHSIVIPQYMFNAECESYEPHLDTERGKAQLMDLVFGLAEKGDLELIGNNKAINKMAIFTTPPTNCGNVMTYDAEDKFSLKIAIIKLALEVL